MNPAPTATAAAPVVITNQHDLSWASEATGWRARCQHPHRIDWVAHATAWLLAVSALASREAGPC